MNYVSLATHRVHLDTELEVTFKSPVKLVRRFGRIGIQHGKW